MHAYAPFGCLCVGSVRSVFQIPWPPCSFFTVLQLALLLVLEFCIGFVTRCCSVPSCVRVGRSLHVCCSSLHQQKKKAEKGKARRIPRPVVFASPISRPEHTAKNHRAHTHELFCSLHTQHSSSSHLSLERRQTTDYYSLLYYYSSVQLTEKTSYCTTECSDTPNTLAFHAAQEHRTSLNTLRLLSHAAACDGKMVLYRGTSCPSLTITQVAVHGPDVEVELRVILLLALLYRKQTNRRRSRRGDSGGWSRVQSSPWQHKRTKPSAAQQRPGGTGEFSDATAHSLAFAVTGPWRPDGKPTGTKNLLTPRSKVHTTCLMPV
jgi:hypothetical protein